jgi:hypothetical protein
MHGQARRWRPAVAGGGDRGPHGVLVAVPRYPPVMWASCVAAVVGALAARQRGSVRTAGSGMALDVEELLVEHLVVGELADDGLKAGELVELRAGRSDPSTRS